MLLFGSTKETENMTNLEKKNRLLKLEKGVEKWIGAVFVFKRSGVLAAIENVKFKGSSCMGDISFWLIETKYLQV